MTDEIVVRAPRVEDATAMGQVHVAAWQVGYDGVLPSQLLDGLTVERTADSWTTGLTNPDGTSRSLVAERDGRILGISSVGPYRAVEDQPSPPDLSELWMINVHPDAWGTGLAQALLAAGVELLRTDYTEPRAALWVLEGNARGRRFYEKEGWVWDGATKRDTFAPGGRGVPLLPRPLSQAPPRFGQPVTWKADGRTV
ncbi:MAG: GNAT family N-acetyltransferase [Actinomycetota bacterium]